MYTTACVHAEKLLNRNTFFWLSVESHADDSVLYFKKQNEINLFEKMKELIQRDELSSRLVLKGIERVKKYNRYNFIKEIEKIY